MATKKKRRAPSVRSEQVARSAPPGGSHMLGAGFLFVAGGVFLAVAQPWPGGFATWFVAGVVGLGVAMLARGVNLLKARAPSRLDELWPSHFFLETWVRMDDEAREERLARRRAGAGYDWRPLIVLGCGAVFLTLMEYWGASHTFVRLVEYLHGESTERTFWSELRASPFARLYEFAWWSGWRVLGYFLLPAITVWLMRERVRDHGLATSGFRDHAWIYALSFGIVLICIVVVSYTAAFSTYYPFYKQAGRSWFDFAAWELLYAAQFFSLEFFFRGYWLTACKAVMGSHAIFAMVVPYCMIHYGKPLPEALMAIVAGIVLGTLAMKTRSIWSGFLIHVSVAVSMDVAALVQTTGLPDRWWPLP